MKLPSYRFSSFFNSFRYWPLSILYLTPRMIPETTDASPAKVKNRPKRWFGLGVIQYGLSRNQLGLSVAIIVSRVPTENNTTPTVISKYA